MQVAEQTSQQADVNEAEVEKASQDINQLSIGDAPADDSTTGDVTSTATRVLGGSTGSVLGNLLKLDDRLPGWESATRDAVHPLFVTLKGALWQLVPDSLRDVVGGLSAGQDDAGGEQQPDAVGTWKQLSAIWSVVPLMLLGCCLVHHFSGMLL